MQPSPVLSPGEPHGQRTLVGYSPRGCKELDTTEANWQVLHRQRCRGRQRTLWDGSTRCFKGRFSASREAKPGPASELPRGRVHGLKARPVTSVLPPCSAFPLRPSEVSFSEYPWPPNVWDSIPVVKALYYHCVKPGTVPRPVSGHWNLGGATLEVTIGPEYSLEATTGSRSW